MTEKLKKINPESVLGELFAYYLGVRKKVVGKLEKNTFQDLEENSVDGWDYFPFSSKYLHHIKHAACLLARNDRNLKGLRLLDLGVGSGLVITFFSFVFELDTYGIDFDPYVASLANTICQELQQQSGFTHLRSQCVAGNYFPENFVVPEVVRWGNVSEADRVGLNNNPYREMGKNIEDFDIFYLYQYAENTPWVIKLLAERARKRALILFVDYDNYKESIEIPSELKLKAQRGRVGLLEVK